VNAGIPEEYAVFTFLPIDKSTRICFHLNQKDFKQLIDLHIKINILIEERQITMHQ
jgi:hypothetical protein